MYSKPSAPQSIGQVLDGSFRLFGASIGRTWLLALAGALVGSLGNIYQAVTGAITPGAMGMVLLLSLVGGLLSVVFYAAVILRQELIASGSDTGGETGVALRRLLRIIVAGILVGLVVMASALPVIGFGFYAYSQQMPVWIIVIGVAALAVLPFIFMIQLLFSTLVIMTEDRRTVESLSVSRQMVKGNWWRTALLLFIGGLIVGVLYFIIALVAGILSAMFALTGQLAVIMLVMLATVVLVGAFVTPYFTALMLAIYHDLKLRKEGGDLSARIDNL